MPKQYNNHDFLSMIREELKDSSPANVFLEGGVIDMMLPRCLCYLSVNYSFQKENSFPSRKKVPSVELRESLVVILLL